MARPGPILADTKLYPPLPGPCLPAILAPGWAVGIRSEHLGTEPLPYRVRTDLEAALDAHAGEILPLIVGPVRLTDDLMHFTVQVRRLTRLGGELLERAIEVPFAYDRRSGQWGDGGLSAGTGIVDFLLWHAHAVLGRPYNEPQEGRRALLPRLLLCLGTATLQYQFERASTVHPNGRELLFNHLRQAIEAGPRDAPARTPSAPRTARQRKRG